MDRFTVENQVSRSARVLLVVSGLATALASVLHLLVALQPLYRFHELIQGYYSLLSYSLVYTVNQQPVSMPHTDYIQHVSLAYAFSTLTLLLVSVASLLLSGRKPLVSMGLIHGCSSTLIVIHGLLRNYVLRAVELDVARFNGFTGDTVFVETLAGRTVFTGVRIESTWVQQLASSWLILIPAVFAVVSSIASIALALLAIGRAHVNRLTRAPRHRGYGFRLLPALLVLPVLFSQASTFNYQPSVLELNPQPPPATLEPMTWNYTFLTCTALTRTSRGALTYTDYEGYPVPGWTSYGGVWELSGGGGFKGNALRGRDNNGGVGGASQYYWNTRIDGYTSLWVSVKVRAEAGDGFKGIGLLNADRTRLYEVSVQSTATIYRWDGAWILIGSTSVPGYSATRWYTLVLNYNVTATAVSFALWIYDDTGALVATLTASDTGATRFTPAYAGVTIDAATDRWFRFDDFIVSTVDPRFLYFTGFYTGMRVEVWDNLGYLVNSTTAPSSSFALGVAGDVVVGTGINGRIVVRYPDGYLCGVLFVPPTDAVLGGDTYALSVFPIMWSIGVNRTSASLMLNISGNPWFNTTARVLRVYTYQVLYARLILDAYTAPGTLNLDVWLEGAIESTSILIRRGVPLLTSTSRVQLNLGPENSVALSGYFTTTEQTATLQLKLELCTAPG
ncbi:MAG: hypothetical protein QXF04_03730, partial [Candidatus Aenigmatarchaeota archaeon]